MDVNEHEKMSNITQIKVHDHCFIAVLHFTVILASSTYPKMSVIRLHILQLDGTLYLSITGTDPKGGAPGARPPKIGKI